MTEAHPVLFERMQREVMHVDFASHPAQRLVLITQARDAAALAQEYSDARLAEVVAQRDALLEAARAMVKAAHPACVQMQTWRSIIVSDGALGPEWADAVGYAEGLIRTTANDLVPLVNAPSPDVPADLERVPAAEIQVPGHGWFARQYVEDMAREHRRALAADPARTDVADLARACATLLDGVDP